MADDRIALRPVARADRQAWGALWQAYLAFYETTLPDATYETAFERLLSEDPATFRGLIAWQDETALGLVHWVRHPHLWRPEGVIYLQDLYTVPEARGRGVARRLMEAVYAAADDLGCPRVYWLTQEGNATARRLYDRIGRRTDFLRYERA
ncbi:GNAT family N-acetyltransferase [Jannaschia formosa]|uniref:GNAT family N-acetyltransferase n=1 Tax=Jannaschia formosa TaxID=2259592 RepID=UPI000E1B6771|nr:GNAT family N-acetyltransferase [Jannaschia formosa]TFL19812.1 GNAT family N-acetyltransferase [Jannaschia formosa]